jgi:hypothetical protein
MVEIDGFIDDKYRKEPTLRDVDFEFSTWLNYEDKESLAINMIRILAETLALETISRRRRIKIWFKRLFYCRGNPNFPSYYEFQLYRKGNHHTIYK